MKIEFKPIKESLEIITELGFGIQFSKKSKLHSSIAALISNRKIEL